MDNIVFNKKQSNLPDTLKELCMFILVGEEKLSSVRAEIRAIEKIGLAKHVRDQKIEECRILAELLLDAETKIGELLNKIPKSRGKRKKRGIVIDIINNEPEITKGEVIENLGFSKDQAHRFELLAKHKDIVEQYIGETRDKKLIISKSKLFSRIREHRSNMRIKKKINQPKKVINDKQQQQEQLRRDTFRVVNTTLAGVQQLKIDDEHLKLWMESINHQRSIEFDRDRLHQGIVKFTVMLDFLNSWKTD